jgi:hypothetical protein
MAQQAQVASGLNFRSKLESNPAIGIFIYFRMLLSDTSNFGGKYRVTREKIYFFSEWNICKILGKYSTLIMTHVCFLNDIPFSIEKGATFKFVQPEQV